MSHIKNTGSNQCCPGLSKKMNPHLLLVKMAKGSAFMESVRDFHVIQGFHFIISTDKSINLKNICILMFITALSTITTIYKLHTCLMKD